MLNQFSLLKEYGPIAISVVALFFSGYALYAQNFRRRDWIHVSLQPDPSGEFNWHALNYVISNAGESKVLLLNTVFIYENYDWMILGALKDGTVIQTPISIEPKEVKALNYRATHLRLQNIVHGKIRFEFASSSGRRQNLEHTLIQAGHLTGRVFSTLELRAE